MKSLTLIISLVVFTVFSMLGCTVSSTKNSQTSEQQVIQTMERFFEILDVDNYQRNLLDEVVTKDFKIFEAGYYLR